MSRAHAQALLEHLQDETPDTLPVFDTRAPDGAALPYVVLHAGVGTRERTRLGTRVDRTLLSPQTTSVGATPDQARWAAERVHDALVDVRITVDGQQPARLRHNLSRPPEPDLDEDPPVFFVVDLWTLTTNPARGA